ncbi:hypothetical protein JCM19037_1449 [Geomicrobium sp. JCM 19037]|nr:hypothetical protein JCM19037_1449 [Geomicrobium sp. JCM 19037]
MYSRAQVQHRWSEIAHRVYYALQSTSATSAAKVLHSKIQNMRYVERGTEELVPKIIDWNQIHS